MGGKFYQVALGECRHGWANVCKRGYSVDAPFGGRHLRLDCPDHQPADARLRDETWKLG